MYIPKNRIITNLYTRGEEYKNASTGIPYTGFYWEMYNGTIFTGKNPNDKPSELLILIENNNNAEKLTEQDVVFQQYAENYDAEVVPNQYQNMDDVNAYNSINEVDILSTQLEPQQYYPVPTDENYELGMVADWDFFLKCDLSDFKMCRTKNISFYHFASASTNGEARQQSERDGHEYAKYKWGSYIQHDTKTNKKYLR